MIPNLIGTIQGMLFLVNIGKSHEMGGCFHRLFGAAFEQQAIPARKVVIAG
jgi:hypothetical protein